MQLVLSYRNLPIIFLSERFVVRQLHSTDQILAKEGLGHGGVRPPRVVVVVFHISVSAGRGVMVGGPAMVARPFFMGGIMIGPQIIIILRAAT